MVTEFSIPVQNEVRCRLLKLSGSPCFYCVFFLVSLGVAPFFAFRLDVVEYYAAWATATQGIHPWLVYQHIPACNYPPLIPYFLTLVQALRNSTGAARVGPDAILLLKLPSILALGGGCWVIKKLARAALAIVPAAAAGVLFATCPAIWFNAAVWGQWDAMLTLAMVMTVLAAVQDRPFWAGVGVGVGLSIKLQSIVILPVLIVAVFGRQQFAGLWRLVLAALCSWALISAPCFIAGAGREIIASYTQAVDKYPLLSISAYNFWAIVQHSHHIADTDLYFGGISARLTGLCLLGLYNLFLMGIVYRSARSAMIVIFAAAMANVAFYQLPTQMHERYGLPACGFFALLAARGHWLWFVLLAFTITVNQFDAMTYTVWPARRAIVLSLLNMAILATASVDLARQSLSLGSVPRPNAAG